MFESPFDPGLIEYTADISTGGDLYTVDVYKIGGGTIGKRYEGLWGVRVWDSTSGEALLEADDLNTGTPHSHDQIPRLALDFIRWDEL